MSNNDLFGNDLSKTDSFGNAAKTSHIPRTEMKPTSTLNAAFTPGPWAITKMDPDDKCRIVAVDGYGETRRLICAMPFEKDWPNSEGNARLIAAAPALYGACKAAIDSLVRLHSIDHDYLLDCECSDGIAFRAINDALNLAEGTTR